MVDGFCVAQVLLVLDETSSMLCQQFLQSFPLAACPVEVRAGNVVCGCRISWTADSLSWHHQFIDANSELDVRAVHTVYGLKDSYWCPGRQQDIFIRRPRLATNTTDVAVPQLTTPASHQHHRRPRLATNTIDAAGQQSPSPRPDVSDWVRQWRWTMRVNTEESSSCCCCCASSDTCHPATTCASA